MLIAPFLDDDSLARAFTTHASRKGSTRSSRVQRESHCTNASEEDSNDEKEEGAHYGK